MKDLEKRDRFLLFLGLLSFIFIVFVSWNLYANSGVIIKSIPCNTIITDIHYNNNYGLTYVSSPMPNDYNPIKKKIELYFITYVFQEHRCKD